MTASGPTTEGATLTTGMHLGPYEIVAPLGAGGMGEVYRARDERLGREVAVKVLHAESSTDPDRLRRFEQEARAAGALSHPNVLTVFDAGTHGGAPYIVFELLEGGTLRAALKPGPLPLLKAVDHAAQIAAGLAAAHEKGILHRDLKPDNLFVTKDGRVKILDFGLAKLRLGMDSSPSGSADGTASVTTAGTVLGTIAYMSPEQVQGRTVDHRSDIYSLGMVQYEMLSGLPAFSRETTAQTVAAILRDEPPALGRIRPEVPPPLEALVRRCLEKDPDDRFQSTRDLAFALQALARSSEARALAARRARPGVGTTARLGTALALLGLAGFLGYRALVGRSVREPAARDIKMVPLTSYPGTELDPSFSPDGRQLAFSWDGEKADNTDVYVQLIGAGGPLRLTTHPAADTGPAWSPDGRFIAFTRTDQGHSAIYLVPALGGPERKLLSLRVSGDWYGLSPKVDWSPDGKTLVFADQERTGESPGIVLLSLEDLERRRLTIAPPQAIGDWSPAFSPDGRQVAFVRWWGESTSDIHLAAVEGGEVRRLSFDELPLVSPAWTPDGRGLVYWATRGAHGTWWMPVSGGAPRRLAVTSEREPALFSSLLDISPDGRRLAVVHSRWDENIWRLATPGTTGAGPSARHNLIASTRAEAGPQFSPDGTRIAFESSRSGVSEIWLCDGDGSNPRQLTFFGGPHTGTPRWSPDGRSIAFDARTRGGLADIYAIGVEGGPPRQVTSDSSNDVVPSWSRDGRHIYFASNRSGRREVWRVPAEGGAALAVTKHGGFAAFESADGRVVYYSKFDEPGIWRVPVGGGEETLVLDRLQTSYWGYWAVTAEGLYFLDTMGAGPPAISFYGFATRRVSPIATLDRGVGNWIPGLAVSPDGRSILYVQPDERGSDILLAENWH